MSIKIITGQGELDPVRQAKATKVREARATRIGKEALEIGRIMEGWMAGDMVAAVRLKEAVSTQDFPTLFNRLVDQGMLAQYAALPSVWQSFSARVTVPDFRRRRLMQWVPNRANVPAQNGGQPMHPLALPRVPELTEYPTFSLEEASEEYGVAKYGERFPFSWEVWKNDEMNVIQDLPGVMSRTALDTEDILTTQVLASPTGPNPNFFNTAYDFGDQAVAGAGNYLSNNGALTVANLERAFQEVGQREVNGRPVTVGSWTLVVPPALEFTARRVASVVEYTQVEGDPNDPDGQIRTVLPNLVAGRFSVVVNPWLPLIDRSATSATTWYLVPTGGNDGTRQVIITAFMAGEETPDLRISDNAGNAIGGGPVDSYRGSFSHDDVQFRVRHVLGAAGVNPAPVLASLGNNVPVVS
jgi:hypothetical protein